MLSCRLFCIHLIAALSSSPREHMKQSKQKARLAFRKTQLIDKLFCSQHEKSFDSSKSIDCNVLVDSDVLKRIFSCNDALDDVFRSVITNKSSFCQHSSGKLLILMINILI